MAQKKTALVPAYKAEIIQTLTGIAAAGVSEFTLSAKGAHPEWMYAVTSRTIPASFLMGQAYCSALNSVVVRISNPTGTSAAIGSCSFDVIAY